MPRLWTFGQAQKINLLVRGHLTGLAPQRQVGFLRNWLRHNAGTSALPLFPTATDAELRTLIRDLGEHLGLYTTHPAFRSALAAVSRGGGIQSVCRNHWSVRLAQRGARRNDLHAVPNDAPRACHRTRIAKHL